MPPFLSLSMANKVGDDHPDDDGECSGEDDSQNSDPHTSCGIINAIKFAQHYDDNGVMSVIVIILSLGLFGIIVGVAYWFAREEQITIKKIPPEEMDEKERQARREAAAGVSSFPPS
jgi:hypothetical protein